MSCLLVLGNRKEMLALILAMRLLLFLKLLVLVFPQLVKGVHIFPGCFF
jgi:hypothetical protein